MADATPGAGVDSESREERIAARRDRIRQRQAALKSGETAEERAARRRRQGEERLDPVKSRAQIEKSRQRIDNLVAHTTELVSNIRVAGDAREATHRADDDAAAVDRHARVARDADASAAAGADILGQFDSIVKDSPHALAEQLASLQESIASVFSAKTQLVSELQMELKGKDDFYVKDLKRQAEDINLLVERMEQQVRDIRKSQREELEEIERAFLEERAQLLAHFQRDCEQLVATRRLREDDFLRQRAERVDEHERTLDDMRIRDAEEYHASKIKLETEVQVLEEHLQTMKATYQLNSEKLEYNYQVLKKRDDENTVTITQQKRKINRMNDLLNSLRQRLTKLERQFRDENQSLTEEYRRLTEQFKELRRKFRHFELADQQKCDDVFALNRDTAVADVRKLLAADKIIAEQQLGLQWVPPDPSVLEFSPAGAALAAVASVSAAAAPAAPEPGSGRASATMTPAVPTLQLVGRNNTGPLSQATGGSSNVLILQHSTVDLNDEAAGDARSAVPSRIGSALQLGEQSSLAGRGARPEMSPELVRSVLDMLCDEAGFLIEEKLQRLLRPLDRNEQSLVKLDAIFKALGVHSETDVRMLATFFVRPDLHGRTALIHPNEVLAALRRFVELYGPHAGASASRLAQAESDELAALSRAHAQQLEAMDQFWERVTNAVPMQTEKMWTALESALGKYNSILLERQKVAEESQSLARQNGELRMLLQQYMTAPVNLELQVAPTATMRL
jgi:dynein regulatry complex protein 1